MNRAIIVGNLVREPEMRVTGSGVSVCSFTVAVNRRYAAQDGQKMADYIPVVVWRQQAEACAMYLHKGSKVSVCGSIQTRSYEAQDGSKRFVTELVADEVEFLTKQAGTGESVASEGVPDYKPAQERLSDMETVDAADDLPF